MARLHPSGELKIFCGVLLLEIVNGMPCVILLVLWFLEKFSLHVSYEYIRIWGSSVLASEYVLYSEVWDLCNFCNHVQVVYSNLVSSQKSCNGYFESRSGLGTLGNKVFCVLGVGSSYCTLGY